MTSLLALFRDVTSKVESGECFSLSLKDPPPSITQRALKQFNCQNGISPLPLPPPPRDSFLHFEFMSKFLQISTRTGIRGQLRTMPRLLIKDLVNTAKNTADTDGRNYLSDLEYTRYFLSVHSYVGRIMFLSVFIQFHEQKVYDKLTESLLLSEITKAQNDL